MPLHTKLKGQTTLADLVVSWPGLIPYFEEQNLDFCCGGQTPLAQMCQERHLDLDTILNHCQQIVEQNNTDKPQWENMEVPELIDYILERFHVGHRQLFSELDPLLEKVMANHGETYPAFKRVYNVAKWFMCDLEPHMQREELILFPLAKKMAAGAKTVIPCGGHIGMPIGVMQQDHEHAGIRLQELDAATNNYCPPTNACASFNRVYQLLKEFSGELRLHVHLENNILFPKLMAMANI